MAYLAILVLGDGPRTGYAAVADGERLARMRRWNTPHAVPAWDVSSFRGRVTILLSPKAFALYIAVVPGFLSSDHLLVSQAVGPSMVHVVIATVTRRFLSLMLVTVSLALRKRAYAQATASSQPTPARISAMPAS